MQKTLYILRHAKAEALSATQEDHERRLTARGVEEAGRMGEYLTAQGIRPDKVLCSTAVRTRETCECLFPSPPVGEGGARSASGEGVSKDYSLRYPLSLTLSHRGRGDIEYNDKLYLASANEMLGLIAGTPETARSLMIIGHNPGLQELCLTLTKDGDNALRAKITAKFPTCALATIALRSAWRDVVHTEGMLKGFVSPKML